MLDPSVLQPLHPSCSSPHKVFPPLCPRSSSLSPAFLPSWLPEIHQRRWEVSKLPISVVIACSEPLWPMLTASWQSTPVEHMSHCHLVPIRLGHYVLRLHKSTLHQTGQTGSPLREEFHVHTAGYLRHLNCLLMLLSHFSSRKLQAAHMTPSTDRAETDLVLTIQQHCVASAVNKIPHDVSACC